MAIKNNEFLTKSVRGVVIALIAQFVLGMLTNMFAVPPDDPKYSTESPLVKAFFPAHAIVGLTLVISSILVIYLAFKSGKEIYKKLAVFGLISIFVAASAGVATISLKDNASEIASFIMAMGFLASFAVYGRLHFLLRGSN